MTNIEDLDLSQKKPYVVSNIELTDDIPLNNLLQRIEDKLNEIIKEVDKRGKKRL